MVGSIVGVTAYKPFRIRDLHRANPRFKFGFRVLGIGLRV